MIVAFSRHLCTYFLPSLKTNIEKAVRLPDCRCGYRKNSSTFFRVTVDRKRVLGKECGRDTTFIGTDASDSYL